MIYFSVKPRAWKQKMLYNIEKKQVSKYFDDVVCLSWREETCWFRIWRSQISETQTRHERVISNRRWLWWRWVVRAIQQSVLVPAPVAIYVYAAYLCKSRDTCSACGVVIAYDGRRYSSRTKTESHKCRSNKCSLHIIAVGLSIVHTCNICSVTQWDVVIII